MALFVDSTNPTVQDLLRYDKNLLDVGSAEGLDCSEKLILAKEYVGSELEAFLRRERPGTMLESVVATEPIRRWTAEVALSLFYRDAHYSQLNERYRGKWKEYDAISKETRRFIFESGVGCVGSPVRKAQRPILWATTGVLAAGSYFVRICWVGPGGTMGEASDIATYTLSAPGGLLVSPASVPDGIVGWHVFAGELEDQIQRQSDAPLPIPGSWQIQSGLTAGARPADGQSSDFFVVARNVILRG